MWDIILDFIIETSKVFGLVIGLSFLVSFFQTFIPFKKFLDKAFKKNSVLGLIFVIALGFLSPFCSCTIIPVVIVLIKSDVSLSLTLAFFTSAALLNITGLVSLFATMPGYFVLLYIAFAVVLCVIIFLIFIKVKDSKQKDTVLAVSAGSNIVVEKCNCDEYEHDHSAHNHNHVHYENLAADEQVCSCAHSGKDKLKHQHKHVFSRIPDAPAEQCKTFESKMLFAFRRTLDILSDIWIFLLAAMIISFVITHFITEDVLSSLVSNNLAVTNIVLSLIGGLLHGEIIALIPVLQLFNTIGLPYVTTIAFLGTAAAVSIPLSITLGRLIKIKHLVIYNVVIVLYYMIASLIAMLF